MSTEVLIRGIFSAIFGVALTWNFYSLNDRERRVDLPDNQRRYLSYPDPSMLPMILLILLAMMLILDGGRAAGRFFLGLYVNLFFQISLYYVLLLLLLPLLRRYFQARSCASLWLLPTMLYCTVYNFMELSHPAWVLRLPAGWLPGLALLWAAGFFGVLLWRTIIHLRFRRDILRCAQSVEDLEAWEVYNLWEQLHREAGYPKRRYRLMVSPAVKTPVSIGLFSWSIRVVLPRLDYRPEDLELILRHELVHIGRRDCSAKFFFTFCTALCWFNPLVWLAMGRSADDMELSCDETVLLEADDRKRRRYASLLLETAGDERGFTTCLSASASAMRYRLKNVMHPNKRLCGGILAGLMLFLLMMTSGYTALAYPAGNGQTVLFDGDPTGYTVSYASWKKGTSETVSGCSDPDALLRLMVDLPMEVLAGNYSLSESENRLSLDCSGPGGSFTASIYGDFMIVMPNRDFSVTDVYYLPQPIPTEQIDALFAEGTPLPF